MEVYNRVLNSSYGDYGLCHIRLQFVKLFFVWLSNILHYRIFLINMSGSYFYFFMIKIN